MHETDFALEEATTLMKGLEQLPGNWMRRRGEEDKEEEKAEGQVKEEERWMDGRDLLPKGSLD